MNCEQVLEIIYDYLNGECNEDERLELEEHVKSCSSCASELNKTSNVINALEFGCEPSEKFKADLLAKVQAVAIEETSKETSSGSKIKSWWKSLSPMTSKSFMAMGSIAAVLVITLGMRSFLLNNTTTTDDPSVASYYVEGTTNSPSMFKSSRAVALGPTSDVPVEIDIEVNSPMNDQTKGSVLAAIDDVGGTITEEEDASISAEISSDILEYFTARLMSDNDINVSDYANTGFDTVVVNIYFSLK